ncbi:glycosyltransferase family 9 protein [Nocardiopsis sp. L17-MgMaSL7]|uniref:glycosyltransferase family 9 protein n=1 Tax=Nocardiopsis sp. L17-MgMaSL7 TaxID=1938893 RepID=UPI000D71C185|nr:glycosyltransferase family 9 protein [Nocardiopsis sp. L17-MgMaSL7]PWV55434.1 ADP-heptose:LPS heptosyltransferase [Nocardiopsis sp. L17-MgMaSL7]
MTAGTVIVARMDSMGDVVLSGPAVRAVAHGSERVVMLVGPRGAAAAQLLPGVDGTIVWRSPWIDPVPPAVERADVDALISRIAETGAREALILTSYHQSPLPLALLLRMAGVGRVSAISDDYPGSLLDVRHRSAPGIPEPERALSLAEAAGFGLAPGDDGRLALTEALPDTVGMTGPDGYVAVHLGADAPARELPRALASEVARALHDRGHRVVVTGSDGASASSVAADHALNLAGRTSTGELADVLRRARVLAVGNTGPAHLAAALRTPVVSLFAPVVPASAWAPYGVARRVLGDQGAPCAGTRARQCPVPGHPCLRGVTAQDVLTAIEELEGPR